MYGQTRYLAWAGAHFGATRYNLASSGMRTMPLAELGPLPSLDDESGYARLTAAIAAFHERPEKEVSFALGASHAIWLAYAALVEPGDDVLVEDPLYEPLWRAADGLGARVHRFKRRAERGYAIDPDEVARAITPRTRVIAVTNLHNPTGVRTPDDVLRALSALASSRGAHLLVDEVYAPFDDVADRFAGTARRLGDGTVAVGSLTKCWGLGSHRIGWVIAPPDVAQRVRDVVTATAGVMPLSHACIGAHAFAHLQQISARSRTLLGSKRARVAAWMASRDDLTWSQPDAGLFGFAVSKHPGDLLPLIELGARDHDVVVAPGAFFGVENGFRLAWSLPDEDLEEALARLARVLPT